MRRSTWFQFKAISAYGSSKVLFSLNPLASCQVSWVSLPARQGVVEEFSQQNDLVALPPYEKYINRWTITVF